MKKYLFNPLALVLAGIFFFAIGAIDSLLNDAMRYSDLSTVGRIGLIFCCIDFIWMIVLIWVIPIFYKLFGKR